MTTTSTIQTVPIGVGIDTSRYGHHVTFLNADLQPAAAPLQEAGAPAAAVPALSVIV